MSTYVLIHGGGHGGWCYKETAKLLRGHGHDVYAPSLSGLADRRHLLHPGIGLETHINDIVNLISFEDISDIILVGHSYGGMVIAGVADRLPAHIAHLVFLDAAIPENGESLIDVSPGLLAFQTGNQIIDGVELGLFPNETSLFIYGIDDPKVEAWALPRLTPHPWKTFVQPLLLANPDLVASKPRTIINCKSTMAVRDADTLHRWTTGDNVWEVDVGHDLMLLNPELTAELLLRLAT